MGRLKVVRNPATGAGDEVDLEDTFEVEEGWIPATDDISKPIVSDTIPLAIARNKLAIKGNVHNLNELLRTGRRFMTDIIDPHKTELRMVQDDTEYASLIHKGNLKRAYYVGDGIYVDDAGRVLHKYNLEIERGNYWEDLADDTYGDSGLSTWVGTSSVTHTDGDMLARIARARVTAVSTPQMYRFWLGFRREREGLTDFKPLWEAEDGTNGTDTTDQTGDATASNSARVECTFATDATLAWRNALKYSQVNPGGDSSHQVGHYLVLGRFKVDSGTEVGIQLRHGYPLAAPTLVPIQEREILFDDTNWRIIPLGRVQLPPMPPTADGSYGSTILDEYQLFIWAERLTGTGSLHYDGLAFIPLDNFVSAGVDPAETAIEYVNVYTRMDGMHYLTASYSSFMDTSPEAELVNWGLPLGASQFVYAAEPITYTLESNGSVILDYRARHQQLRGIWNE